ncbi:hypothetical protein CJF30_00010005 [Rutstroemia sp. NJR-2017a BBW]|nr:hypothetical protein CJF30_00010005 [Rutstroemia sp. NJR-2017a BBW]
MVSDFGPPLRIPSEAPEVVQDDQSPYLMSPDKFFVRSYSRAGTTRPPRPVNGLDSKSFNDIAYQNVPPLRRAHALAARFPPPSKSKRKIGLIPLALVAVTAFLVGGGIGGGIGSWAGKRAGISSTSNSKSTSTSSASPSTVTLIVDSAFCPLINGETYTTPAPAVNFLMACQTDITPSPGENIELMNVTTGSFKDCMNTCATYNNGQCQAATWIQFSPTSPQMNSKCFLKANGGVPVAANSTGTTATSAYRVSS